jgi:hypothetical protein
MYVPTDVGSSHVCMYLRYLYSVAEMGMGRVNPRVARVGSGRVGSGRLFCPVGPRGSASLRQFDAKQMRRISKSTECVYVMNVAIAACIVCDRSHNAYVHRLQICNVSRL